MATTPPPKRTDCEYTDEMHKFHSLLIFGIVWFILAALVLIIFLVATRKYLGAGAVRPRPQPAAQRQSVKKSKTKSKSKSKGSQETNTQ
ncbi:hypothetical protein L596_028787 [Steinernema carpocapsae]|uniref:Uncharacterized protein n=1 Tax=Steinernema carpocapsae TaxID=34508 RepID=A0A4U5LZF6_STECR|nr:hypothetical protein L596_028787 [Steinernema carpocapsae]